MHGRKGEWRSVPLPLGEGNSDTLNGYSLWSVTGSHEVWWVPLYAVSTTTAETVLAPSRMIIGGVRRRSVVGCLLLLLRKLGSGWLRKRRKAEHGTTQVALKRSPSAHCPIVFRGRGPCGRRRGRRVVISGPPRVILRVAWSVVRRLRRLGRVLIGRRIVGLLHRQ